MELTRPRWREDPAYLEQIVACQADVAASPADRHEANRKRREEAMAELPEVLASWGGSFMTERVLGLAREAQALLPYREIGKHYLMMGYELIRAAIAELGRRWSLGNDVFFLRLAELGGFEADRLRAEVTRRKVRWQSAQRLDLPNVISSSDLDRLGLPRDIEAASDIEGVSLSSGVAEGTARIIYDPKQAGDLGDRCILVCPSTDPSWTALFTRIRGLIVERGCVLSHGAITARDFGIPAVACPDATLRIGEGSRVGVDGDRGHVTVIEGSSDA